MMLVSAMHKSAEADSEAQISTQAEVVRMGALQAVYSFC